jgi:cysteine-rich repeat protein
VFALTLVPQKRTRERLSDLAAGDTAQAALAADLLGSNAGDPTPGSAPAPRALDSQNALHAIGLAFANHPDAPQPIAADRVDAMLEIGSFLTRSEDDATDLGCCTHFVREGDAGVIGATGDGLDIVSTEAELDALLDDRSVRFKVVRAINWCGGPGTNFSGCATQRGFGAVVVRLSDPGLEAGLWLHEYGHNAGLEHVANTRNVMSPTGGWSCGPLSICPDDVWTQTQCDLLHAPPSATRSTPENIGVCGPISCGNGQLDPFELCDDGNASSEDECTNECRPAVCGDGVVFVGIEECDDGNVSEDDACLNDCSIAFCGDGRVQSDQEQCDDANADNGDACLDDCALAACGDGFLHVGVESCDDRNAVDGDGCDTTCRIETCHACEDEPSSCMPLADGSSCDDGDPLTRADRCTFGTCAGDGIGLDGMTVYAANTSRGMRKAPKFGPVTLTTSNGSNRVTVADIRGLALPGAFDGAALTDPTTAFAEFPVRPARGEPRFASLRYRNLVNTCAPTLARIDKPVGLLVPARLDPDGVPAAPQASEHALDSMLCFKAKQESRGPAGGRYPRFPKGVQVEIADGFQSRIYELKKLARVCEPASVSIAPDEPPTQLSGPEQGSPRPVPESIARRPQLRLACYKAGLARRSLPQAVCATADPRDGGERIDPRQEMHAPRLGLYVTSGLGEDRIDTKKEVEICLPSVEPVCGNDAVEPGETCDGADDDRCPGECSGACRCGASEDLRPCGSAWTDRWEIAVERGDNLYVVADTTHAETAADLRLRLTCAVSAHDLAGDDEIGCTHLPPRGLCPEIRFQSPSTQTCMIEVEANEGGCADLARADYALDVRRDGEPLAPVLVGDDAGEARRETP